MPTPKQIQVTATPGDLHTRQWLADCGAWWNTGDTWSLPLPADPDAARRLITELTARGLNPTDTDNPGANTP